MWTAEIVGVHFTEAHTLKQNINTDEECECSVQSAMLLSETIKCAKKRYALFLKGPCIQLEWLESTLLLFKIGFLPTEPLKMLLSGLNR